MVLKITLVKQTKSIYTKPEKQPVSCHGIDDSGHGEQRPQQADSESCDSTHSYNILPCQEAVNGKHLHKRGIAINQVKWHQQCQNHTHLRHINRLNAYYVAVCHNNLKYMAWNVLWNTISVQILFQSVAMNGCWRIIHPILLHNKKAHDAFNLSLEGKGKLLSD